MNFLQLVQNAMREGGVTQTDPEPSTLTGVTGITLKFKNWVQLAWEEFQLENDDAEFRRTWFSSTVTPKFYFDLADTTWTQPSVGDTLQSQFTLGTVQVTKVVIINGGIWANGTAQGFIEFENLQGSVPMIAEPMQITNIVGTPLACRFVKWGDYLFTSQLEMGDAYVSDMEDIWWESLKIQDMPSTTESMNETALQFVDYSRFMQEFDTGIATLNRPIMVTETPDDGVRMAFYPPPDQIYRIQGFYTRDITQFVLDTDEPTLLKQLYHPMLFWRAVKFYGKYEGNPVIEQKAMEHYMVYKKRFDREGELPVVFRPVRLY